MIGGRARIPFAINRNSHDRPRVIEIDSLRRRRGVNRVGRIRCDSVLGLDCVLNWRRAAVACASRPGKGKRIAASCCIAARPTAGDARSGSDLQARRSAAGGDTSSAVGDGRGDGE